MILNLTRPDNLKIALGYWAAPLFAAVLSALTMVSFWLVKPHSYDVSLFFCFLPMAFFFVAAGQVESRKQVRALQQRIEQLEAQAVQRAA